TVTPDLVARWESERQAARRGGIHLVPLGDVLERRRVHELTTLWDDCFAQHWAVTPSTDDHVALLLALQGPVGLLATSLFAYPARQPIGGSWAAPEHTMMAVPDHGPGLRDEEKMSLLCTGVHRAARAPGVHLAPAAHTYLPISLHGVPYLSYPFLLDDNW